MTSEVVGRDRTRNAIVEAAARLLAEDGYEAVTTRGVARAAGVQAPAIYRLFGDKDGLVAAVAEHVMATWVATKTATADAAAGAADPVADLRAGWDSTVEFGLTNPVLFAVLGDPRRQARSAAVVDGAAVLRTRVHRVAAAGLLRVSEDRAVALIHAAGTGMILTLISTPPEHRDGLLEAGWAMVRDAILIWPADRPADRPDGSGDGTVSAAVAVRAAAGRLPGLSDAERSLLGEWLDRAVAASGRDPAHS